MAALGVAGLAIACHRQRARFGAVLGFVFGVAFFVPLLSWVRVVGVDAWLALSGVEAVFFAGLGAASALCSRLRGWQVWVAALWVGQELVRDRVPFGGFPWGRLAFSQGGTPYAGLAALGGAPLVSFAVALSGTLLAAAALGWATAASRRRGRLGQAVLGLAAVAVAAVGLLVPVPTGGQPVGGPAYATVAAVQGNVPRLGLDAFVQRRRVLANHVSETERLARLVAAGRLPRPDAVIWPEDAVGLDPFRHPEVRSAITAAVRAVGVPVLVGALVDAGPTHLRNTGIVWSPRTGPGPSYAKQHLVPFGEYVPFRSVLTRWVTRLATLIPRDFVPGHRPGVLQLGPVRIGDVICFEVAYDGIVRAAVRGGGRLLVVQTNNATYGRSGETDQQLAMSQLRAVEHGRAVVIAATSGISAVISPSGRVVARTGVFTPAVLDVRVPLRTQLTVADRIGALPEWLLAVVGVAALAVAAGRAVRGRGQPW